MLRTVARTQAVFYRDPHGAEPVDEFINALPSKRAAKIDAYIDEHLNGRRPDEPPPEYPISSQLDGELRELRVRFANTRYRVLYQRSTTWSSSSTPSRRTPGPYRPPMSRLRNGEWPTSSNA